MSGMADEMARRMAEDGGAGAIPDGGQGAGVVPGTGNGQPEPAPSAAAPSTPDSGAGTGTPDTIPYARFKEVNDRYTELRGFEQLTQYGYDPDSLGRLAAFEAQYLTDPVGTWKTMADNLDLPQGLKDALETHLAAGQPGSAEGEPSAPVQKPPEPDEDTKRALEWVRSQQLREADQANEDRLNQTIGHWDELDKADGIETPEQVKLMAIAAMASSGTVFRDVKDLAKAAREPIVGYRGSVLGAAVRTGRPGTPLAVPGSAPVPAGPVSFGTDIKAATRAAQGAIERGEIPS